MNGAVWSGVAISDKHWTRFEPQQNFQFHYYVVYHQQRLNNLPFGTRNSIKSNLNFAVLSISALSDCFLLTCSL